MRLGANRKVQAYGPAPQEDFLAYPGVIPSSSYIYSRGNVEVLSESTTLDDVDSWFADRQLARISERIAVLCVGSNANPLQTHYKLQGVKGDTSVFFLRGSTTVAAPVFSCHIARYGAVPATIDTSDRTAELHAAFYTEQQLRQVTASEHSNYDFARLEDVAFRDAAGLVEIDCPFAFVGRHGVLTLDSSRALRLDEHSQPDLLRQVLARISADPSVPSFQDYVSDPIPHKQAVQAALRHADLCRPHTLSCRPFEISDAWFVELD